MPKLTKAERKAFAKNPKKFLSNRANAAKIVGMDAVSRKALAKEIATLSGVDRASIASKLDTIARVSGITVDW